MDTGLSLNMEDVIEQPSTALEQSAAIEEAEDEAISAADGGFDLDFDLDLGTSTAEPEFDLTDVGLDESAPAQQLDTESAAVLGAVTADAGDIDEELDFLSDADEAATKLDLARAYIDMGDKDGARDILAEVLDEGRDDQKREAQALLDSIS
ncbi:MAG: FimV/HubP family polar landmark protein [Pseudomonadales bacterium]